MNLDGFNRRVKTLESRSQADQGTDDAAQIRLFLKKLTDEELERSLEIAERTHDGTLPLTVEEQSFLDEMEAKYEHNST